MSEKQMFVVKRSGQLQAFDRFKIASRLGRVQYRWQEFHRREMHIDLGKVVDRVVSMCKDRVTTAQLDEHAANTCADILDHTDYADFGGAILASNLESQTRGFATYLHRAMEHDPEVDGSVPLLARDFYELALKHADYLESHIVLDRNMKFDYFGISTLIKQQYLLHRKSPGDESRTYLENPQFMYMRVALWIHRDDIENVVRLYDLLSKHEGSFGTPTFLNAGSVMAQGASCFLTPIVSDSIEGIYRTLGETAEMSKAAGGVGIAAQNVRCAGSHIAGTNGTANGLAPMLRVFNTTAEYVDQGGGKRKGSFAIYMELWHADIFSWIDLKRQDNDSLRARELHYGLWWCDLFGDLLGQQLKNRELDLSWYLMDPKKSPELIDLVGDKFVERYWELVAAKKYVREVKVLKLWHAIEKSVRETGNPYIVNKDQCNLKSNQQNLGTIRCSNLCTEIVQYSSSEEIAVCVLASISQPAMLDVDERGRAHVNFQRLHDTTCTLVLALNRLIDVNHYPLEKARISAQRHRAIAIGFQGRANMAYRMFLPYDSREFAKIDAQMSEACYFAQLTESHRLAVLDGPYESIDWNGGAPIRHGKFQFDLWREHKRPRAFDVERDPDLNLDWEGLRAKVMRDGVRNSETSAQMPTASTSQIMGNYESIFPPFGLLAMRKTLSGEFILLDKDLVRELQHRGLWTANEFGRNHILEELKSREGSVQHIASVPQDIKDVFKTVWEIKMNDLLNRYYVNSHYISESTSWNLHFADGPEILARFTRYVLRANELGIKTIMYYFHTKTTKAALTCNSCSA